MSEELKVIIDKLDEMESRFDKMETRFDEMENRFDKMETRIDEMETRFDNKLDARLRESENMILEYVDDRTKYLEGKIDSIQKDVNQLNDKYDVLLHEQGALRVGLELAIKNSGRIDVLERDVRKLKNKEHIRVL